MFDTFLLYSHYNRNDNFITICYLQLNLRLFLNHMLYNTFSELSHVCCYVCFWPYSSTTHDVVASTSVSGECEIVSNVGCIGNDTACVNCIISSLLVLPRSVLRAVTVTTRSKSPRDFKPLPPPASSPPAAELHHKLQPSANLRNSVNVDLYLWAVLKVYYN